MVTRRQLLTGSLGALGSAALTALLSERTANAQSFVLPARVKRVIWLFQSGAPSQIETFDPKPMLKEKEGSELPASIRRNQRLTTMTANQSTFTVVPSPFAFSPGGQSGAMVSDLLPYTRELVDQLTIIRSMYTEAINHDPAITFMQTGHEQPGRPCAGAWVSYGLGRESEQLPAFVVLLAKNSSPDAQPLYSRLWSSGFLPSAHQGVQLRAAKDPVLYLGDPVQTSTVSQQRLINSIQALDRARLAESHDPDLDARIRAFELAYQMQASVPELTDLSEEPESTFELYGPDARIPGTHAANCLLARRLAERGVRFIQLYHRDWDHHTQLPHRIQRVALESDRGSAALVRDLAQRGLLDDTLVIWGGEFGRTAYAQGEWRSGQFGRDHHPRCFSIWLAGGGVKKGFVHGTTDDFSYNIEKDGVHVHDLHATILRLLGIDHQKLTYLHQGRELRLTDVSGRVVHEILDL